MEQLDNTPEVFLLQHPLAHAKDPPVAIPTLPRHRQTNSQVPPTPTSLPYSLSPPGSPVLASTHSPLRRSGTPSSTTPGGATGITSKFLHSTTSGASGGAGLARDLTTRLWQREAELQTMKDLYDAKIKRLTEMLQDAGVSPTEVENNLAVVVEETVIVDDGNDILDHPFTLQQQHRSEVQRPLFDHISVRSGRSGRRSERLFDDDDDEGQERLVEDETEDQSESMSSSASILSSCPVQFTRPDLLTGRKSEASVEVIGTRARGGGRIDDTFSGRPSMESTSTSASTTSTKHYPSERPFSPTSMTSVDSRFMLDPPSSTTTAASTSTTTTTTTNTSSGVKAHSREGQSQPQRSQSPVPSFISESLAAGTLGMKTLREKWAVASGVLSWSKPRSDSHPYSSHQQYHNISSCSSIVTSPSGLFISRDGIMNDKKPALVEASIPPPLHHRDDDVASLSEKNPWPSVILPSSRKLSAKTTRHLATRPMSDAEVLHSSHHKYPPMAMAQDIPRPPISSVQGYLQRPESFNPSPLHYRAISMAANLIDTGAITPAKLYARRTQTMIAKWTMGLIMNSKPPRSCTSVFPVIRESYPSEQEETSERRRGSDDVSIKDNVATTDSESVSSYERYSTTSISPTDIPRALSSFRSHASSTNLISSSYSSLYSSHQPPPSSQHSQHLSMMNSQSIVELSDISSPPLSMSPSSTYLGECKPLTDRYGFIVNARPMAVQQGLLKLNEVYGNDDMDSPHNRGTYEYLQTPSDESELSLASPTESRPDSGSGPSPSAFYSGYAPNMTTSPPPSSLPTSVTSPVLSTATRPTSTLSPPSSSSATVTTLLSQIKVMHDSVQLTQKEKWDAFLRKRKRRVHLGEANGNMSSTNLGSPLFGGLSLAAAAAGVAGEEDQDDDDVLYWTSVCIIGIATIGKGSEWEEFRDLVRGGIPVTYRNKIWQEASGAYDLRQPGYYKEILAKQKIEECVCWGDIDMDLHRTFPTNILFGPGGHGIDKLKNILIAYSLYNPVVGYCQGMNLLAGTLLLTNNSEEEAFWILASMLGRHLPEDYFTSQLLSPQADQRVLKELVHEILPRLHEHFQEMHVDLTAVTFSWFLTLFTDCLPVETLLRVWDVFFVEGMLVLFKVAVAVLWMNEKEILKCRNGAAVYCFMKQMTLGMHQADKLMKVAFITLKSYIHPEKIEAKRQRHQRSVRQELLQEQQLMKMRTFACASPPPRQQQQA
ncbi:hypothetical protein BGZ74_006977 [Mortierella antarctica]|nr:hypothetical protein BGZ74_006977 [Mortierella antarctica]